MSANQWLSLFDYSMKHGLSLSTLRRRIKSESIQYKLENGKYFLLDDVKASGGLQPAITKPEPSVPVSAPPSFASSSMSANPTFVEASVISSANRLVEELKAAYAKILQEKEEQISLLKEEVVDLRMLVKILESQVEAQHSEKKSNEAKTSQASRPSDDVFFGEVSLPEV